MVPFLWYEPRRSLIVLDDGERKVQAPSHKGSQRKLVGREPMDSGTETRLPMARKGSGDGEKRWGKSPQFRLGNQRKRKTLPVQGTWVLHFRLQLTLLVAETLSGGSKSNANRVIGKVKDRSAKIDDRLAR